MEKDLLDGNRLKLLKEFESSNGLNFSNIKLLDNAFFHSSYVNELPYDLASGIDSNERLEFLGDSVLALIVNEYIFTHYPDYKEGQLSELKSIIVSEVSLAEIARSLGLGKYILLGNGEISDDIEHRDSILSDTVEAIMGAYYLDSGLEKVKDFILPFVKKKLDDISENKYHKDYKSILQQYIQRKYKKCPMYKTVKEEGPDHNRLFYIDVLIEGEVYGSGKGYKKKSAQQEAAHFALDRIRKECPDEVI